MRQPPPLPGSREELIATTLRRSERRRRRTTVGIVAVILLVLALPAYVGARFVYFVAWGASAHAKQHQQQLLYETDHTELLAACQTVLSNPNAYPADPNWMGTPLPGYCFIDPKSSTLPPIIHKLDAGTILAGAGELKIELGGGFEHYGVVATPAGPPPLAMKQLVPGLWYYSEAGKVPPAPAARK